MLGGEENGKSRIFLGGESRDKIPSSPDAKRKRKKEAHVSSINGVNHGWKKTRTSSGGSVQDDHIKWETEQ